MFHVSFVELLSINCPIRKQLKPSVVIKRAHCIPMRFSQITLYWTNEVCGYSLYSLPYKIRCWKERLKKANRKRSIASRRACVAIAICKGALSWRAELLRRSLRVEKVTFQSEAALTCTWARNAYVSDVCGGRGPLLARASEAREARGAGSPRWPAHAAAPAVPRSGSACGKRERERERASYEL